MVIPVSLSFSQCVCSARWIYLLYCMRTLPLSWFVFHQPLSVLRPASCFSFEAGRRSDKESWKTRLFDYVTSSAEKSTVAGTHDAVRLSIEWSLKNQISLISMATRTSYSVSAWPVVTLHTIKAPISRLSYMYIHLQMAEKNKRYLLKYTPQYSPHC